MRARQHAHTIQRGPQAEQGAHSLGPGSGDQDEIRVVESLQCLAGWRVSDSRSRTFTVYEVSRALPLFLPLYSPLAFYFLSPQSTEGH